MGIFDFIKKNDNLDKPSKGISNEIKAAPQKVVISSREQLKGMLGDFSNGYELKVFLLNTLLEVRKPSVRWACLDYLYLADKLTNEEVLSIIHLGNDTSYVIPLIELLREKCDFWEDTITIECIKSLGALMKSDAKLYIERKMAAEMLLDIFNHGLFKGEIRKYNGTVLSEEYFDDENGHFDGEKFWTCG